MPEHKLNFAKRQKELAEELSLEEVVRKREDILRGRRVLQRDKRYDFSQETFSQEAILPNIKTIKTEILWIKKKVKENNITIEKYPKEAYIKENIKLGLLGLSLIKYEYSTEVGYIDILCTDELGESVVIEVKKGIAKDSAVGQVLGYMNAVGEDCRGIIVARSFTDRVKCAVKHLNIKLIDYRTLL